MGGVSPRATALFGLALALLVASSAAAQSLPDKRAYELVTRYAENGTEVGLGSADPDFTAGATNGETVDWKSSAACCGATTGGVNVYQSLREGEGWQTDLRVGSLVS
jgi:hypothetical protein